MPLRRTLSSLLAALLLLACATLHAQAPPSVNPPVATAPAPETPPSNLYTLHVYANLAQVPTIVFNPDGKPIPALTRDQFFISLDGGPFFHPSLLRVEGDDAISLAIIIEDSGEQSHFITDIADTLSKLAPKDLHPKDHVSVYAIDCNAIQSVNDAPASAELIRAAVKSVLSSNALHGGKNKPSCSTSVRLWDVIAHAIDKLADSPSRRAVLVISLGMESKSATSFEEVIHMAQGASTAIFGLRDIDEYKFQRNFRDRTASGLSGGHISPTYSDNLSQLALRTGGLVFDDHHPQIEEQLHTFIAMLRSRYIVEFPRPDNGLPGTHQIGISIPSKMNYLVRFTGASLPLPDPTVLNDPNTVPSAPSPATFGNQRPKKQ